MLKPVSSKQKINPVKQLKEKIGLKDKISTALNDKGVELFRPVELEGSLNIDKDYLSLPKDITDEPSRDLGRYLNSFTQQRMYLRTLIGWQLLSLEESKRKYYEASTPIYITLTKKDFPSETAKERYINNHPDVEEHFFNYKDEKRKLDILQMNLLSVDDAIFLVSREISRRGGDFNAENRNDNVQRR